MNNVLLIIVFALCLFARCTMEPLSGGSTDTELGSVVAGSINDRQGRPLANAPVVLIPQHYDPVKDPAPADSQRDTTDVAGNYRMRHVNSGVYNILATDQLSVDKLLITGVLVAHDDTTRVLPDTLVPTGSLRIILPDSLARADNYVYLPGTPFFALVEGNGTARLNSVPAGYVPQANLANIANDSPSVIIKTDLTVATGDTTTIAYNYAAWKFSKKLVLNTSTTGADIAGMVTNFPILVRLLNTNFDFSQAGVNGEDLRFAKSDGTPLPFEIERWNSAAELAEVWVKVDTIYGNNSTQSIIMFYGNPSAARASNGAAVFDTANGFMGVWHLGEPEPGSSTAADATGNGYDGIPSPSSPTSIWGNIGMAKRFDGISQYITMPNTANSKINFPPNGVYCISAWVSVDTTSTPRQVMISKGNTQYTLEIQDTSLWAFTEFKDLIGWEAARSTQIKSYTIVRPKTWTLVTGIRSGDREYLYIDGGLSTDTTNQIITSVKSRLTSFDLSIGRVEDADTTASCYFGGMIDEVRISNVAPNWDWITLCFRNQKYTDELVKFR